MSILISMLTAVLIVVSVLLVLLVMMQRPKQEGLGAAFGAGMTDQMFGAQTTNVLQKGTVWLAVMFFVITMLLAILIGGRNKSDKEFLDSMQEGGAPMAAETTALPQLPKPPESMGAAAEGGEAASPVTAIKVTAPGTDKAGEGSGSEGAKATSDPVPLTPAKAETGEKKPAAEKEEAAAPAGKEETPAGVE